MRKGMRKITTLQLKVGQLPAAPKKTWSGNRGDVCLRGKISRRFRSVADKDGLRRSSDENEAKGDFTTADLVSERKTASGAKSNRKKKIMSKHIINQ